MVRVRENVQPDENRSCGRHGQAPKPEEVTDEQALFMAKDIAKKIEKEMEYPGQIKVNVIRETRSVDYAK